MLVPTCVHQYRALYSYISYRCLGLPAYVPLASHDPPKIALQIRSADHHQSILFVDVERL